MLALAIAAEALMRATEVGMLIWSDREVSVREGLNIFV